MSAAPKFIVTFRDSATAPNTAYRTTRFFVNGENAGLLTMPAELAATFQCRLVNNSVREAAPDLYAALSAIISPDGKSVYGTKALIEAAVAALAKAES